MPTEAPHAALQTANELVLPGSSALYLYTATLLQTRSTH